MFCAITFVVIANAIPADVLYVAVAVAVFVVVFVFIAVV